MRFLKYLILVFLILLSCEEEVFNNKDAELDNNKISNCSEVVKRLELCLELHEGALSYLEQSCSVETVKFVKENVDSYERLIDYFIEM